MPTLIWRSWSLIRQLPQPFLLLGDNAKHPAWDFENSADPRGRAVQSLLVESLWGCSTRGGLPITTSKQTPSQPLTCAFAQLENFRISSWRWMRTCMGVTTFPSIWSVLNIFFFFFFMNGNTERAQCALPLVCMPQEMGKAVKIKKVYRMFKKYNKKIMPSAWLKNKGMYNE